MFLRKFLPTLTAALSLRTALDVGCGVGYFSQFLTDMNFQVTGHDGRQENVAEARRRYPEIDFQAANVEDPALRTLPPFDLVLCFGLMSHLEQPVQAFRNLRALTGKLLLMESACIPEQEPIFYLHDEREDIQDQGLSRIVSYPSEGCLIKMAYRVGFAHVYQFTELPDNEEFQPTVAWKKARTILAISDVPLQLPFLVPAAIPPNPSAFWPTGRPGVPRVLGRLQGFLHRPWHEKMETLRRRLRSG